MALGQLAAARSPRGKKGRRCLGREEQMLTERDAGEEVNSPVLGELGD